jgi:hypothetical protein
MQTRAPETRQPFPPRINAKRPTKTASAANLYDPEVLGTYGLTAGLGNRPSGRMASRDRSPSGSGFPASTGAVKIYSPRRVPVASPRASFQPNPRFSIGVCASPAKEPRTYVQRSQSYTHFQSPDTVSRETFEPLSKEHTEQSTNGGEAESKSPSSNSDDAVQVNRATGQSNLHSESAANLEHERAAYLPDAQSIVTKDVPEGSVGGKSDETKSTAPLTVPRLAPQAPSIDLPQPDPLIISGFTAPTATPTITPRSPCLRGRAMPSVPAGAQLTPRRAAPAQALHGRALDYARPMPGVAARQPSRVAAPAAAALAVATPRNGAAVAKDALVAQSCFGVKSEMQLLRGYAAKLETAVGDTQAQLVEAVTRNKDLVEGDQIIAQSCAGVQEELHRIRSYAATLSTVVEDRQVVTELAKMSDFAKELETFLPQRPLQPALSS